MNQKSYSKILIIISLLLTQNIVSKTKTIHIQPKNINCSFLKNSTILKNHQVHVRELSETTQRVTTISKNESESPSITEQNYIDTEIFGKMKKDKINSSPLCTDEEFIRRITLDLTGKIPTADQVKQFSENPSKEKRDRLIDTLIGSLEYVDRWTMWLGDLLQNTSKSTNVKRFSQGRNAYYTVIKQAVQKNLPYNEFVSNLITATGNNLQVGEVNNIVGARTPMGPDQDTLDAATAQTAKRFLGIETLDCLLCHNGQGHLDALNLWASKTLRSDAWKISAFFARTKQKRNLITKKPNLYSFDITDLSKGEYKLNTTSGNRTPRTPINGQDSIKPEYFFTKEKPNEGESYRTALARILTKDRQFARATVNYVWEHFFNLGIVDPPTNFDLARLDPQNPPPSPWTIQPSHPELLEKLTTDFINNNYNLQQLMRTITKSSAYQLSSRYEGKWKEEYTSYFARKLVRRLDAEEIHDAIAQATGILGNYQIEGFTTPVQWAMQLPDTSEPMKIKGIKAEPSTTTALNFLNTFSRGDRDESPRTQTPSILQSLTLMNNPFVISRIKADIPNGTVSKLLSNKNADDKALIKELFLTVLSRQPSSKEIDQSLALIKADRTRGTEDLMWVLLNKIDFLYNY